MQKLGKVRARMAMVLNNAMEDHFTPVMIERGLDYYRAGKVRTISHTGNGKRIVGSVKGTRSRPYDVEILLDLDRECILDASCTCPVAFDCKHAVAVCMEYADDCYDDDDDVDDYGITSVSTLSYGRASSSSKSKTVTEAQNSYAPDSARSESGVRSHVRSALERLAVSFARSDSESAERKPTSKQQILLYVLKPGYRDRLDVEVVCANINKSGGIGAAREYPLSSIAFGHTSFANKQDVEIARFWAQTGKYGMFQSNDLPEDPELLEILIRRAVATNRCVFGDKDGPVLSMGPDIEGSLRWLFDGASHCLQVAFGADDKRRSGLTTFLQGPVPMYVNLEKRIVGKIITNLPPDVLDAAVDLPAIFPGDLPGVRLWLQKYDPRGAIPLPAAGVETEVVAVKPIPQLWVESRKSSVQLRNKAGKEVSSTSDVASLSFDFPGLPVNSFGEPQEVTTADEKKIVLHRPDLKAIPGLVQELKDIGIDEVALTGQKGGTRYFQSSSPSGWIQLLENADSMRSRGWNIHIDKSFQYEVVKAPESDADWFMEVDQEAGWWFSLNLGIVVDNTRHSLLPILGSLLHQMKGRYTPDALDKLAQDGRVTVPLSGGKKYVKLPVERIKPLFDALIEVLMLEPNREKARLSAIAVAPLVDSFDLIGKASAKLKKFAKRLLKPVGKVEAPQGLRTQLRDYQLQGLAWLQLLGEMELGGILADDMGLGKTVQTLAHLLVEKESGRLDNPALVVCPTSVLPNWLAEARRLAPDLEVLALQGADRHQKFKSVANADVVITTYPLIIRDLHQLNLTDWHCVILDESQKVKNHETRMAQAVRELKADHRICLTGTPVENNLSEVWSQFAFLLPGLMGDHKMFLEHFRKPIEKENDLERLKLLTARLRPFMLRRTKAGVAAELPPKETIVHWVELTGKQRDLYESVRLAMHDRVRAEIKSRGIRQSQIVILDAILKVRQVCCDPRLLKIDAAKGVNESAKLESLMDMLESLLSEGRRVLLFSQFTSMLDLIKINLHKKAIPYCEITGATKDRVTPVQSFQAGKVQLFLISLKAGGTGLNLTAADTVIHYDPWWNPAVEDQATDRAHRIGQDKNVFVYKLIAQGTIEERMLQLQETKRWLAEGIFDPAKASSLTFDEEDIKMMFAPIPGA